MYWKVEKYDLIFKIVIFNLKNGFFSIALINSYLMIGIYQIKLSKLLGLAKIIKKFFNQGQKY